MVSRDPASVDEAFQLFVNNDRRADLLTRYRCWLPEVLQSLPNSSVPTTAPSLELVEDILVALSHVLTSEGSYLWRQALQFFHRNYPPFLRFLDDGEEPSRKMPKLSATRNR